jgi:virginiamycin B lyase
MTFFSGKLCAAAVLSGMLVACAGRSDLPQTSRALAQVSPGLRIREYRIPRGNGGPYDIIAAPGSQPKIWFTQRSAIGELTPRGKIKEHPQPKGSYPFGITIGSDGNVWYTADVRGYAYVGRWKSGRSKLYPVHDSCCLGNIVNGPDGALWFPGITYYRQTREFDIIGRATTTGSIDTYLFSYSPGSYSYTSPTSIASGSDGALWFAESGKKSIGRITTALVVTNSYPVPSGAEPYSIAPGPDGALWFTENRASIGRIDTSGNVTEYSGPSGEAVGITAGPDGAVWFTETTNKIGRITTSGSVTEYPVPTPRSEPLFITTAPDGSLWFTEHHADKLGQIILAH